MSAWSADDLARRISSRIGAPADEALVRWAYDAVAALESSSPSHRLDADAFAAFVAEKVERRGGSVFSLIASDLTVAFACAHQDAGTLHYFDKRVLPRVRPAVARIIRGEAQTDDVMQQVRERVLLPEAGVRARIATFGGDAPLVVWLRATAVRVALNSVRGTRPEVSDEDALQAAPAALDLEADTLRALHKGQFEAAFKEAMAQLLPRDRALLKLFFIDGVGTEGIGRMYAVNKSTVSRWLAAARAQLLERTRQRLAAELNLGDADVRSLVRFIRSRADLRLSSLLR